MAKAMTIAIASGKGGTGKTTIATNLACSIAQAGHDVQYLDCDVEEPNGHIFLKPQITTSHDVTVDVPDVDLESCISCERCGQICQFNAIVSIKDKILTFEQLCHSCGGCWQVCPVGAINRKQIKVGIVNKGKSGKINFIEGKLNISDVRTPKVIQAVKNNINTDCVTIIDVPPGTTCPTIEAIKNTDYVLLVTEPTPFGLNDLKLAVEMVRVMNIPFGIVLNRYGEGDENVEKYCTKENIDILLKIPSDRKIAENYSEGHMIIEKLPEYKESFLSLAKSTGII